MSKEIIRFKGLTLDRDEQQAQHGELALCGGVELHDGALRPSVLQGSMVQHDAGGGTMVDSDFKVGGNIVKLLYVHDMPSYRHFIGVYNNGLYWFNEDGTPGNSGTVIHTFTSDTIISINSVGNTLVVLAESGVHYILWKDSNYKYLGTQIPFIEIAFRPSDDYQGKYNGSLSNICWYCSGLGYGEIGEYLVADNTNNKVEIKEDKRSFLTDAIHALVNRTNNIIAKEGHFYAPFFIRYCYRLYDGSMVMHSAPVYMNVSHPYNNRVYCLNVEKNSGGNFVLHDAFIFEGGLFEGVSFVYVPSNVGIKYAYVSNSSVLSDLKNNWSDIVKSVDVFVTPPLVRENAGELISQIISEPTTSYGVRYAALRNLSQIIRTYTVSGPDNAWIPGGFVDFPMLTEGAFVQKLCNSSNFFKIASYSLEDLTYSAVLRDLKYDTSVIANVSVQEQMKDDYHTHNLIKPINLNSGMYVYNHRLNLYGMEEQLFKGFSMESMLCSCADTEHTDSGGQIFSQTIRKVVVELDTEDGKKVVHNDVATGQVPLYCLTKTFFFYPDSRASKMTVYYEYRGSEKQMSLKLEPLNFLNGAASMQLFWKDDTLADSEAAGAAPSDNDIYKMLNKVITSEVDNPYYFPVEGRNTIGTGSIIGVAAVTRALSQGQVGDHDLVVFATDGIWVMKVSSEGTYSAIHNISREVCTNPKSICQLDQSIVFATERSLARFVESDVPSMSDMLDGPIPDWEHLLPSLYASFPDAEHQGTEQQQLIRKLLDFSTPAVELFNKGSVFYDYASSRVVVLPEANASGVVAGGVALVFSIRDRAWSTMPIPNILSVVPGYPSPFVQTNDGKVMILDKAYNYAGGDGVAAIPGLIITRELTFSDTMDVIRGYRQYSDLDDEAAGASPRRPMLYVFGSNDQRTWKQIGYSDRWFYNYMPGTPFRFFRVAVFMQMKPSEEYQQLELEVVNKYAKL